MHLLCHLRWSSSWVLLQNQAGPAVLEENQNQATKKSCAKNRIWRNFLFHETLCHGLGLKNLKWENTDQAWNKGWLFLFYWSYFELFVREFCFCFYFSIGTCFNWILMFFIILCFFRLINQTMDTVLQFLLAFACLCSSTLHAHKSKFQKRIYLFENLVFSFYNEQCNVINFLFHSKQKPL